MEESSLALCFCLVTSPGRVWDRVYKLTMTGNLACTKKNKKMVVNSNFLSEFVLDCEFFRWLSAMFSRCTLQLDLSGEANICKERSNPPVKLHHMIQSPFDKNNNMLLKFPYFCSTRWRRFRCRPTFNDLLFFWEKYYNDLKYAVGRDKEKVTKIYLKKVHLPTQVDVSFTFFHLNVNWLI